MIHGILNVRKEKGYTSHDVVAKLRGIVGQRKIGHTGTLDPDAEGVLPICLGRATKLCDMLTDKDKTYEAVLLLGCATDTQDITGTVLESREVPEFKPEEISDALTVDRGITQISAARNNRNPLTVFNTFCFFFTSLTPSRQKFPDRIQQCHQDRHT